MGESKLIGKEVKLIFKDGADARVFEGRLVEISQSHFTIFTKNKLQLIPAGNVIRVEGDGIIEEKGEEIL